MINDDGKPSNGMVVPLWCSQDVVRMRVNTKYNSDHFARGLVKEFLNREDFLIVKRGPVAVGP